MTTFSGWDGAIKAYSNAIDGANMKIGELEDKIAGKLNVVVKTFFKNRDDGRKPPLESATPPVIWVGKLQFTRPSPLLGNTLFYFRLDPPRRGAFKVIRYTNSEARAPSWK